MKETDKRFVNLEKKVGIFFIIAVVGIAVTAVMVGIEHGAFTPKFRINFTVDRGTGFFEGLPVKLSGFKIGKIESLSLDENARVRITLQIKEKYHKWIRQDSIALLTKEGLIGESIIEITVGTLNKPVLEDGASIQYEKTSGYEELVEDIKPVLGEMKNIISYINDPAGDIKQTIGNLRVLTAELKTTRALMDRLLKNTDKNISGIGSGAEKTLANIDTLAGNVGKTVSNVEWKIVPVLEKLDRTADNAEKATSNLKDTLEKSTPKIPAMISKGEDAIDDANDVMKSIRQIWPVRLFIEEPREKMLHGDSYE